ncbi:MAG: DUF697 domain-containing protein [Nitrosomonas sp.]|nr:DUF697 domain-containing protein [Nitrosomonas sp.]
MTYLDYLRNWPEQWKKLQSLLLQPSVDQSVLEASLRAAQQQLPAPVLWLLGKTQSGKTSIIRALTGSETAQIGNGFQPCTRYSRFYDFPETAPIVRFLDTRGIGEVDYDPAEDIDYCDRQAHLLLVVMKAADINQQEIFSIINDVRRQHPHWPLLMVQTSLHELYSDAVEHILPWPYQLNPWPASIPSELQRALLAQRAAIANLPGDAPVHWVPVDLTLPEDGYTPSDYGLAALWQAIEQLLPLGLQQQLSEEQTVRDVYTRAAHQQTVGYAFAAAGLGALPVVDLVAVTALQAKLLHSLAVLYRQRWDARSVSEFVGLLGTGAATAYLSRMISRTLTKLIPFAGQTVGAIWGASASGAATYALGKASIYFFEQRKQGLNVDPEILRRIYAESLETGRAILSERLRATAKRTS